MQVFNVPELITRNSLYYTDQWFDKALFVQTGVNFKYFTSYNMNAYDPVLAEFYVQNDTQIGSFPLIDIFFNMKIQQTRVFFIAEHVNSSFTGNDFLVPLAIRTEISYCVSVLYGISSFNF